MSNGNENPENPPPWQTLLAAFVGAAAGAAVTIAVLNDGDEDNQNGQLDSPPAVVQEIERTA